MVKKKFSNTTNFRANRSGSQQNTSIPLGVRHAQFEGILHGVTSWKKVDVLGRILKTH
jgi:hypothetical protein